MKENGSQATPNPPSAPATTGYFLVNGLNLYYEIHGTGQPLVLLHGGICTIEITFEAVLSTLAQSWQVIAIEQQGHGHTADLDRPLNFPQMADDTADLLRHLGIEQAHFLGHSDGGNVGLGVAIRHPDLVQKLVVVGTNYNKEGLVPEVLESFKTVNPEDPDFSRLKESYQNVAPRPEDWPRLVEKVFQLALAFPGWSPEDLKALKAPTLILIGDADVILPEHAVDLFRLIPQSKLAILPGADHSLTVKRADWLLALLADFLQTPSPTVSA